MKNKYESPLSSRYASDEMLYLFSPDFKFTTWHKLWIALAKAEQKLGLDITDEQISEMEEHADEVNYESAEEWERKLRHDVMAHIHAFGEQCPKAMPIIHLGATSCYVGDNTDVIIMHHALQMIQKQLVSVIAALGDFAEKYKDIPTLAFTHFQPAQLTTVGKRATLWANELLLDLNTVSYRLEHLQLLGSKGTTGTQASFLELFEGDYEKVRQLDRLISEEIGINGIVPVSGQTYSRKVDYDILAALSGIAQSASKFATDFRLLSHLKEIEEPFEGKQVGSSAMPYKRNPMRSERICSLARYIIVDAQNAAITAATQWFERTLDDSANKRISVPEAFLAANAILNIYLNIIKGATVHTKVIEKHVREELPFMATENIMMDAVKKGGDRQELHEKIRQHSLDAGYRIKELGLSNNLVELIAADESFGLTEEEITEGLDPSRYIGCCVYQVEDFLNNILRPQIRAYSEDLIEQVDLKV